MYLPKCLKVVAQNDQLRQWLHNGHVCTTDLKALKWPYLQGLAEKGRKFRLELPLQVTLDDLTRAFDKYIEWYCRREGQQHSTKLSSWAAAVIRQAKLNLENALTKSGRLLPQGYPGLMRQFKEAKGVLVFTPDDRAPHADAQCIKSFV